LSIKYCLLVVKTRTYIRLIFIILSFLSPILIEKRCNYLKVTDIHSQTSFSGEDKPQQNRERKKKHKYADDGIMSSFFFSFYIRFFFPCLHSTFVAITVIAVFYPSFSVLFRSVCFVAQERTHSTAFDSLLFFSYFSIISTHNRITLDRRFVSHSLSIQ